MTFVFRSMKLTIILALAALVGCSGQESRPETSRRIGDESRPLIFLTYPTEPPTSYVDASGNIAGTDVDMARRIAAKMGRSLSVESVEFNDILPRLRSGTADFAIATIVITEARSRDVDFSRPYGTGGACFLYATAGRKPRMSQIASLRIGVEADSVHDLYICRHGCNPVRFVRLQDAIAALDRGEIDAVFFDSVQLIAKAGASNGRYAVTSLVTRDCYGVAVDKRRPDILAAANAVIDEGGAK